LQGSAMSLQIRQHSLQERLQRCTAHLRTSVAKSGCTLLMMHSISLQLLILYW
jgi:hypothetical protein